MRLENETPFPAKLFRTSIAKNRLGGSLALRVTYEWKNGGFQPAEAQDWIVSGPPWDTPYGQMPGDELFYRGGVDIFILGSARPPQGLSTGVLDVQAELGAWRYGVRVFGDRIWQRRGSHLAATPPRPITAIPLTLAHAFGGTGKWDGLDVPFAPNPAGKGFYVEEEDAEGQPLPNIEDPANLIQKWDDRPLPVGMGACPQGFSGRMTELIDPETSQFKFSAKLFNAAFPAMVAPAAAPGDILTVRGISSSPEIKLPLPLQRFEVRLTFGDEIAERNLAIDQVGLEFDKQRIFVSYRYPFTYVLNARQQRRCVLRQKES
jgi:hypothetical protein